ncbi:hypothetical protein N802_04240 [Knoellia sinensis KCTC 19936]|uniref:Uncharacterized protein n=1 Tax=Knoellia sinensis KCTC 19936 TaxID=1385520 RepID=A0A0A0J3M8_9MICO|nr:hypothetical protein N802_04240 [Knoellia sinensis KCTC 19936]
MLRRKYLSLGAGEFVAAAVFAGAAVFSVAPRLEGDDEVRALWSALGPLLVVLVQGGGYWLLARRWVGAGRMTRTVATAYRIFRIGDVVLLGLGLAGLLTWWPERTWVAVLCLAVWAFGVVEYVNYFVVRLAYPPRQWLALVGGWKTPRLVLDLESSR